MEEQKAISSIITPRNLTHNIHTDKVTLKNVKALKTTL